MSVNSSALWKHTCFTKNWQCFLVLFWCHIWSSLLAYSGLPCHFQKITHTFVPTQKNTGGFSPSLLEITESLSQRTQLSFPDQRLQWDSALAPWLSYSHICPIQLMAQNFSQMSSIQSIIERHHDDATNTHGFP